MKYLFTNLIGSFVFDNQLNLVEEVLFGNLEEYYNKEQAEKKLKQKYKDWKEVPEDKIEKVLSFFKNKNYFSRFYQNHQELTRQKIKESVSADQLIIQTVSNIEELNKVTNLLSKRLREWYSWYLPELGQRFTDHEQFIDLIIKKNKKELLKDLKLNESMGADLNKADVEEIVMLGRQITELYKLKKQHELYLKKMMEWYSPNILELAGVTIGGKLIEMAKSLKRLALLPASTVQLLGAEKALFRHLKSGTPSPKYGIIVNHPLIQKAKKQDKGKAARTLADKLSLCARLDFFKGEFKAPEYKKELEERVL
ncbi:MAG: NOP5/NOP56 family protein [Candidatus Woesearchaeota archaeon]